MSNIQYTLKERGSKYGNFKDHAELSQSLQDLIKGHICDINGITTVKELNNHLPKYMTEALNMICHKLARIANGDPYYDDSWRDIAGYSQLVVDILAKESDGEEF